MMRTPCLVLVLVLVLVAAAGPALASGPGPDDWIVLLRDEGPLGLDARVADLARRHGAEVRHVFRASVRGFAGTLPAWRVKLLAAEPGIEGVYRDLPVAIATHRPNHRPPQPQPTPTPTSQVVPTGIERVGGLLETAVRIDGQDDAPKIDVAIIDTGVQLDHPDLRVAGGTCFTGENATGADNHGHGTFCAGLVGARDNAAGVVGICPGARIWAVKVLHQDGSGALSEVMAGVDWVANDTLHAQIAIANLSLTADDPGAGNDPLLRAVQAAVAKGIVVTCAAGNEGLDAGNQVPARYDEVLCVSALCDTDGKAGGTGPASTSNGAADLDDTFADFSNFGAIVDVIAPGVDVRSTYTGSSYAQGSGTSFASPLVAGAAALYRLTHPLATPADVRAGLLALAAPAPSGGWRAGSSPAESEPLLDVSRLVPPPPGVLVAARLDQASYPPGSAAQALVTASVYTESGAAIVGLAPTAFVVDLDGAAAAVTMATTATPGAYAGALSISSLLAGAHAVTVSATDGRGFTGEGRAAFEVAAAPAAGGGGGTTGGNTGAGGGGASAAGSTEGDGGGGGGGGCTASRASAERERAALLPILLLLAALWLARRRQ